MARQAVSASDLVAVLREWFEEIIPINRRARSWGRKWKDLEEFADDADDESPTWGSYDVIDGT